MIISIIVAIARNSVIGKDNDLIWHLPADLKHFKQLTMGSPIIMGRKTFESIGKPLPGRTSVIITRDKNYKQEGCLVVHSLDDALNAVADAPEVFIIGGQQIYQLALPLANKLYITHVHAAFEGDVYFPIVSPTEWKLDSEEPHQPDEKNMYPYTFCTYLRKK